MIKKIFPDIVNNVYEGRKISLYAFALISFITISRSLIHILSIDGGAQSIASIPIDTFGSSASNSVIFMFALWGLSQLIMGIFYLIILFRYKSLIPLMYLFIFFEYAGRFLIGHWKTIETIQTAPGEIGNYILIPLSLILFVFSIRHETN